MSNQVISLHCIILKIIRCGGSRGRVALSYKTEEGTAKVGRDYQHTEGELVFDDGETE